MEEEKQWPPAPDKAPEGEPDHLVEDVVNFRLEYRGDTYKLEHDQSPEALLVGCNLALISIQRVIDKQNELSKKIKDKDVSKKEKQALKMRFASSQDMQAFFKTRKVLEDLVKSYAITLRAQYNMPIIDVEEVPKEPEAGK